MILVVDVILVVVSHVVILELIIVMMGLLMFIQLQVRARTCRSVAPSL